MDTALSISSGFIAKMVRVNDSEGQSYSFMIGLPGGISKVSKPRTIHTNLPSSVLQRASKIPYLICRE